ncbi:MAG TPA: hypothetical protein VFO94_09290, partial [Gammaproteobacteria bacterium]|nr:hypothetical protein [Gammaproteobacteria bacterium]
RQRRRLKEIVVGGAGAEAKCFVLLAPDGGGSVMLLGADAAARLAPGASLEGLLGQCRAE